MKIYIAGKYSADNVIGVLRNIREGTKVAAKVLKSGHSPFCPWLDHQFSFYEDISIQEYYNYSTDFLKVCDAILVLPGSENSKGTQEEIALGKELKIPIYYSLDEIGK